MKNLLQPAIVNDVIFFFSRKEISHRPRLFADAVFSPGFTRGVGHQTIIN